MIESNGILGTLMSQSHAQGRSHLTDKQSQLISDTLSKYDPNNLTKADAKEITSSFREAGIRPSRALKEAILADGLDAKIVSKKAELQLPRPSSSVGIKESFNISENQLSELYKLLHQYHSDDSLDADRNSLLNSIQGVLGRIEMLGHKEVTRAHETNQKIILTV
jgi:Ca2+-binding EF-hand superfamily protein